MQAIIDDGNEEKEDEVAEIAQDLGSISRMQPVGSTRVYTSTHMGQDARGSAAAGSAQRWDRHPIARGEFIIKDFGQLDINSKRPQQGEFIRALCWVNVDAFYHVDPENPPTVPNTEMRILTSTEEPAVSMKQQRCTPLEREHS
jgi:hypothetical protein